MPLTGYDLYRVASVGGGLMFNPGPRPRVDHLVALAAAGRAHGATLTLLDTTLSGSDMMRIAMASPGNVTFSITSRESFSEESFEITELSIENDDGAGS